MGGRPAGRYWCRSCGASGLLGDDRPGCEDYAATEQVQPRLRTASLPHPEHIPQYRQLYELTGLWAHRWLLDAANPEPLEFLDQRGITREVAERHMLGYTLHDEQALVAFLTEHAPELLAYAQEAGLLVVDRQGLLRTHWNLCGALLRPEGLYSSHLVKWRRLRAAGLLQALAPQPRGPKPVPSDPVAEELARLRNQNARLQARLTQAELVIDVQKK